MKNAKFGKKFCHAIVSRDIRDGWHEAICEENESVLWPKRSNDKVTFGDAAHFIFSLMSSRKKVNTVYWLVDTSYNASEKENDEYLKIISALSGFTKKKAKKIISIPNSLVGTKCKILTQTDPITRFPMVLDIAPLK